MEFIEQEGVEALSMRKLGAKLGVEAMSLYNHVPNKGALLDGVVELLLKDLYVPGREEKWEFRVKEGYRRLRKLGLDHPNVFPLLINRPPQIPDGLWLLEEYLKTMIMAGFDRKSAFHAFRVLTNYTVGYTMADIRGFALEPGSGEVEATRNPRDFPTVTSVSPLFGNIDHDAEFDFGLDLILTGLRQKCAN